jgi:hypothetical protein
MRLKSSIWVAAYLRRCRFFLPASPEPVAEQSVEERLAREIRFDPDAWIIETEDKAGRHFLDLARSA